MVNCERWRPYGSSRSAALEASVENRQRARAVLTMLNDPKWSGWSDREIARRAAVSNNFVSTLRPSASVIEGQIARTVERNGKTYTMNTSAIGKRADDAAVRWFTTW